MLKEILSGNICAECRMCCVFDRYDIWETPVFDENSRKLTLEFDPEAKFARKGGGFVLNVGEMTDGELYNCPALTENGCVLGDNKPFDCRIWPFRIMERGGKRSIAVSTLCREIHDRDHEELKAFLKRGLAAEIFAYADKNPEAVKPYYDNYTVILEEFEL